MFSHPTPQDSHTAHLLDADDPGALVGHVLRPPLSEAPQWYRRSVFYEVLDRLFCRSAFDGTGDFRGVNVHSGCTHVAWGDYADAGNIALDANGSDIRVTVPHDFVR